MTNPHSFRGLLQWATHRIPGVPAHAERPAGHQGTAVHVRARRRGVMPAWQRRIAAFFGRDL